MQVLEIYQQIFLGTACPKGMVDWPLVKTLIGVLVVGESAKVMQVVKFKLAGGYLYCDVQIILYFDYF